MDMYLLIGSVWYSGTIQKVQCLERDTTHSTVVIRVKISQNEFMVEIYCKSLVRAIDKVLCVRFS